MARSRSCWICMRQLEAALSLILEDDHPAAMRSTTNPSHGSSICRQEASSTMIACAGQPSGSSHCRQVVCTGLPSLTAPQFRDDPVGSFLARPQAPSLESPSR